MYINAIRPMPSDNSFYMPPIRTYFGWMTFNEPIIDTYTKESELLAPSLTKRTTRIPLGGVNTLTAPPNSP